MPINKHKDYKKSGDFGLFSGRGNGKISAQYGWYQYVSNACCGKEVIDVGCGAGFGMEIIKKKKPKILLGIDVDPKLKKLKKKNIAIKDISDIEDKSFDIAVCCDVIEHIKKDNEFLGNLLRVTRKKIFLTTPNWYMDKCKNKFHYREYTPLELKKTIDLFNKNIKKVNYYKGTSSGNFQLRLNNIYTYSLMNYLSSKSSLISSLFKQMNIDLYPHLGASIYVK